MMDWDDVPRRLMDARIWWVATGHPVRGPHAVPIWGVVADGTPWTYGDDDGRRLRDLADDPRAVLHLESGTDVVIVRGRFADGGPPRDRPDVCNVFATKYSDESDYLPDAPDRAGTRLQRFSASYALLWNSADDYTSIRVDAPGGPS